MKKFFIILFLISSFSFGSIKIGNVAFSTRYIKYRDIHIKIGRCFVHSGWKKYFLHPNICKDVKRGEEGNKAWYESTAIDGSYTQKIIVKGEENNIVYYDFYLKRHNVKAHGSFSIAPLELQKDFVEGAKIIGKKGGKIIKEGKIGKIKPVYNFYLRGCDEIIIENLGYKVIFKSTTGSWLGLRNNFWLAHIYGNLEKGKEMHIGVKIEFSGEGERIKTLELKGKQKEPEKVKDAYITPEEQYVLIPQPKEIEFSKGEFFINSKTKILIGKKSNEKDKYIAEYLRNELKDLYGIELEIKKEVRNAKGNIVIGEPWKDERIKDISEKLNIKITKDEPGEEGYYLIVKPDFILISGSDERGCFYGVQTLLQLLRIKDKKIIIPSVKIKDWPTLKIRGTCFFNSPPVPVESFKEFVEKIFVRHKLNTIILGLDQWFNFPSHPEINPKGVKRKDLERILEICKKNFIYVIPEIECLRSCYNILRYHPELKESKGKTVNACPSNPDLYKLLFDLFKDTEEIFKPYGGFKYFSIGCDEVEQSPFGVCERCKKTGKKPYELFAYAIKKFYDYWKERGVKIIVYHDSLVTYGRGTLVPARKLIPKDIIVAFWGYWDGAPVKPFIDEGFPILGCYEFHSKNAFNFANINANYEKGLGIYHLLTVLKKDLLSFAINYPNVAHHNYLLIYAGDCGWNPGKRPPNKIPYNMYQVYLDNLSKKKKEIKKEKKEGFIIDLEPFLNKDLPEFLSDLPEGKVRLEGYLFDIKNKGIALWGPLLGSLPDKAIIPINKRAEYLIFLHGCLKDVWNDFKGYSSWKGKVGEYRIYLEGDIIFKINLITCNSIQAFTSYPEREVREPAFVAWQGEKARVYGYKWENPAPSKIIEKVEFISSKTKAGPTLLAITGIKGKIKEEKITEEKKKKEKEIGKDLVVYLDFNAGFGNIVKDLTENRYNGNCIGNPEWGKGIEGSGIKFDGKDDYISVGGEKIEFSDEKSFTINFWVNPEKEQKSGYRIFITGGRAWNKGTISARLNGFSIKGIADYLGPGIVPGRWQMVTLVYNSKNKEISTYLNGKLFKKINIGQFKTSSKGWLRIGAGECGRYYPDGYFKGIIDEFKVYKRALGEEEIKKEYESLKK